MEILSLTCLTAAMLQEQQLSSSEASWLLEEQDGGQQQSVQAAWHSGRVLWNTYIGQP